MTSKISTLATVARSVDGYLARQITTRENRDSLVRQLGLLFASAGAEFDEEALDSFDALFARLIVDAETDTRGYLALQLCTAPRAPRETVLRLARDEIAVARPILIHSVVLGPDDLVAILRDTGISHMAAVAERSDLTVEVTDVLILRGDDEIRRNVAGNHAAPVSATGYKRLSLQARDDIRLEAALIARDDVPAIVVRYLVRHGPGRAREAHPEGFDPATAPGDALREAGDGPVRPVEAWYAIYDFEAAEVRVAAHAEQGLRGIALLSRLVAEERFPEAVIVVARLVGVRRVDVMVWLTARDPEAFLFAARVVPIDPRTLFALLNIGPWRHILDGRARRWALERYKGISPERAWSWLRGWRSAQGIAEA